MGVNSCGVVMQTPLPLFSLLLLLVPSRGQSTNKPEPDDKIATYVTFLTIFLMAVVCKKKHVFIGYILYVSILHIKNHLKKQLVHCFNLFKEDKHRYVFPWLGSLCV